MLHQAENAAKERNLQRFRAIIPRILFSQNTEGVNRGTTNLIRWKQRSCLGNYGFAEKLIRSTD